MFRTCFVFAAAFSAPVFAGDHCHKTTYRTYAPRPTVTYYAPRPTVVTHTIDLDWEPKWTPVRGAVVV